MRLSPNSAPQVRMFSMPSEARRPVRSAVAAVSGRTRWERKFITDISSDTVL
jgi:hypothetical protein